VSRFGVSFPFYVAQRYLRSTRRDAFVTFLSVTAAGGIALGVAALILSSAALTGFQAVLRSEILARTPHIEVSPPAGTDLQEVASQVEEVEGVMTVRPWLRARGWLVSTGRARPVEIVGFEGSLPEQFPEAEGQGPGLYISDRLVEDWGLEPGEIIEVISARPTLTPLGPQPRVLRLPLAGSFAAGRTEQEERIALPLAKRRSSRARSPAEAKRADGSFSSAFKTIVSRSRGVARSRRRGERGSSLVMCWINAGSVAPTNGGRRVSASYSVAPSE